MRIFSSDCVQYDMMLSWTGALLTTQSSDVRSIYPSREPAMAWTFRHACSLNAILPLRRP
jgi:hypothetical protein